MGAPFGPCYPGAHYLLREVVVPLAEWLTSLDHKRIGIMYVILALVMLLRGSSDAVSCALSRPLRRRSQGFCAPGISTRYSPPTATIMILFMAMPFMVG